MNAPSAEHGHGHDHEHGHEPDALDNMHVTLGGYMMGFALSVLLTAIPFWLVMAGVIDNKQVTAGIITAFAAVQIVVHVVYFLHLNAKSEQGWTMLSTLFTVILVVITLAGSMWVMYHLDTNMHPVHDMSQLP
jgi:cytochrome o ubiquinol oxidase subunit IV